MAVENRSKYLAHLVRELHARYPGVSVIDALIRDRGDGVTQQWVTFAAPLETLRSSGLLTDDMLNNRTPIGDGFVLVKSSDSLSKHGCWKLSLFTESVPRERDRFSLTEAKRVLKRIAKDSLPKAQVRHG
jgi:hypothetical protein